jgi:hypothetical protein
MNMEAITTLCGFQGQIKTQGWREIEHNKLK